MSVEGACADPGPGWNRYLIEAFLLSTGVIFLAELGDRSQLMALTFATKFRARTVLLGITVATALVHLASVALGIVIGSALPTGAISIVAGVAFLAFAACTRARRHADRGRAGQGTHGEPIGCAGCRDGVLPRPAGDKTMLATITLATDHGLFGPG